MMVGHSLKVGSCESVSIDNVTFLGEERKEAKRERE